MGDSLPSDHDTVETHRLTLSTVGRTDRPRIELPDELGLEHGDIVTLSTGRKEYVAQVAKNLDGSLEIRRAVDNRRLAKTDDEGENRLAEWVESVGLDAGRSVLLDVLVDGKQYGLRKPGDRVVYTLHDTPSESLSDIASDLDE